jgi:hypothetical protein
MSSTDPISYQPKNILLKYSEKNTICDDKEINLHFEAEILDKKSKEYEKYFSDAEDECFIDSESHIVLDYDEDETKLKKIFESFDTLATEDNYCFYDMRKTVLKYLLYKYGENDKCFFWEKVKTNFLDNYYFIDKIEQLIEKAKGEKKKKKNKKKIKN